jgi:hypothetical protein
MDVLAHYRPGFLVRRSLLAAALIAALCGGLLLVLHTRATPVNPKDGLSPLGLLLYGLSWLFPSLLIVWSALARRRPLLWVQDGELVLAHRWISRIRLADVRRVELTLAGLQSRLVVESEDRTLRIPQRWAREELQPLAVRIRSIASSREWVASPPVIHPPAPTPVG